MRSHPLRPSGLRSLGLGCLGLVVLSGCTTAEGETARTEPWQKDELALSRSTLSLVRFRAAPDQALAFVVKNKQGTVQGRVPLRSAELELDPQALDLAQARLSFDLEGMSVGSALQGGSEGVEGAAPTEDLLLTQAARLWLRLGPDVPASERAQAQLATFTVRLGRALSSHSVSGGSVVPVRRSGARPAGSVRRVSGTVEGDLLLLGLEVTHVLRAEVDFTIPPGQPPSAAPERVLVRLSSAEAVHFSEHRIQPRDARGAVASEQVAALGRSSNLRALVTGSVVFERLR